MNVRTGRMGCRHHVQVVDFMHGYFTNLVPKVWNNNSLSSGTKAWMLPSRVAHDLQMVCCGAHNSGTSPIMAVLHGTRVSVCEGKALLHHVWIAWLRMDCPTQAKNCNWIRGAP